jgi:hypothetical protein
MLLDETAIVLAQAMTAALLAILFLQSGLDKVIDRKGNVEWLTGHFASSPLAGSVPAMLTVITVFELLAGALSAIGVVEILLTRSRGIATAGALLSAASLVQLFFGQRIAKDYAGAAVLVPYFLLAILAVLLFRLPG